MKKLGEKSALGPWITSGTPPVKRYKTTELPIDDQDGEMPLEIDDADYNQFQCVSCDGIVDIEDIVKLGGELYCVDCSEVCVGQFLRKEGE